MERKRYKPVEHTASPVWEAELATLLFLKFALKPSIAPPLFITDTSQLLQHAEEAAAGAGEASSLRVTSCERGYPPVGPSPYRDPATANISSYVFDKYVRPSLDISGCEPPPAPPHSGARSPRAFAALIDPESFARGGLFVFRYRRPDDLVCEVAKTVVEHVK